MQLTELDQRSTLERIDQLLELTYRSADLGNLNDPLAETIYIVLSKQTREAVYQRVYGELRARFARWSDLLEAERSEVERLLAPAGFQRQRADHLLGILKAVAAANRERATGPWAKPEPQDLNLESLRELDVGEAERFLTNLPGIGP